MDQTQRGVYGLKFEVLFLRSDGAAFETLFARIMASAYPGDFIPVRPHGNLGDFKCDGHRRSTDTIYQSYAPKGLQLKKLTAKIDEDFNGAKAYWPRMRRWEFVYNETTLPAPAEKHLDDLAQANPGTAIGRFGYEQLRGVVMGLERLHLEDLFGPAASAHTFENLTFDDLEPVIIAIQQADPGPAPPIGTVSLEKLDHNKLSDHVKALLTAGRLRGKLLDDFFATWPDANQGERIAQGFRNQYLTLKGRGHEPDAIFQHLQTFAGGMDGLPSRQSAVLAVLAYYFDRCDIFEDVLKPAAP